MNYWIIIQYLTVWEFYDYRRHYERWYCEEQYVEWTIVDTGEWGWSKTFTLSKSHADDYQQGTTEEPESIGQKQVYNVMYQTM